MALDLASIFDFTRWVVGGRWRLVLALIAATALAVLWHRDTVEWVPGASLLAVLAWGIVAGLLLYAPWEWYLYRRRLCARFTALEPEASRLMRAFERYSRQPDPIPSEVATAFVRSASRFVALSGKLDALGVYITVNVTEQQIRQASRENADVLQELIYLMNAGRLTRARRRFPVSR